MTQISPSLFTVVRIVMLTILCGSSIVSAQGGRDRTPPTAPTNLAVTATTSNSVSLSWGASTDNSGSFSYLICCAGSTVTVSQTQTTHTLTGLKSGATYVFRVYAKDAAGNISKSSNAVTVTVPGSLAAPTKPAVQVGDVGPTHASLSWSSTDDGPTIWYVIYIDGNQVTTLNSRSGTFTPLDQDTTYTFTVRARDVDGNWSPMSDPVFVTTDPIDPNDQIPPTQPANLTADSNGAFLTVRWEASTDDLAPQQFIRYDVYLNGELRAVVVGSTTAEVEADYGENTVTVIAVDTADHESAPSTIIVVH
jgi:chitinase